MKGEDDPLETINKRKKIKTTKPVEKKIVMKYLILMKRLKRLDRKRDEGKRRSAGR